MERLIVAVGSTRQPKLSAVSEALTAFGPALEPGAQFEVVGVDAPSGVGHTPTSRAELMAGARGRVEALRRVAQQRGERWSYFVGLEGGLEVVHERRAAETNSPVKDSASDSENSEGQSRGRKRWVFLQSWAFVADGAGREAYGQSGGILLPEALAAQVLDHGAELSAAIDTYTGGKGIRDAQGAWGVLTRNLITRQEAFRIAVIHAFAPFFNATLYSRPDSASHWEK
jgi:non-canonical (house-cleaning) NTP pyrophosphatase